MTWTMNMYSMTPPTDKSLQQLHYDIIMLCNITCTTRKRTYRNAFSFKDKAQWGTDSLALANLFCKNFHQANVEKQRRVINVAIVPPCNYEFMLTIDVNYASCS